MTASDDEAHRPASSGRHEPQPGSAGQPVTRREPASSARTSARRWSSCAARACTCTTPRASAYLDFVSGIAVNALGYDDAGLKARDARRRRRAHAHVEPVQHGAGRAAGRGARRPVVRRRRCSSATPARRRTRARSSSRAAGRARRARRSTRSSRCAARSTGACSARSRRRIVRRTALPFRPLAPGVSIVERDLEELGCGARARRPWRR